jgi:uncharacterized membrane protein
MIYRMSAALLSLTGFFISAYLYLYKIGKIGSLACGAGGCEQVQLSPWSRFAGIEVSLIGLVGYIVLLAVSLWSLRPGMVQDRRPARLMTALTCLGVGFTLYLTYLELFVIHAVCRWCVASGVIIVALLVAALLDQRRLFRTRTG